MRRMALLSDCEICLSEKRLMVGMSFPPGKTIGVKYEYDPCPGCTPPPHSFYARRRAQMIKQERADLAKPAAQRGKT